MLSGRDESWKAKLGTSGWGAAHSDHGRRRSEPRHATSQESRRWSPETARPPGELSAELRWMLPLEWGELSKNGLIWIPGWWPWRYDRMVSAQLRANAKRIGPTFKNCTISALLCTVVYNERIPYPNGQKLRKKIKLEKRLWSKVRSLWRQPAEFQLSVVERICATIKEQNDKNDEVGLNLECERCILQQRLTVFAPAARLTIDIRPSWCTMYY